MILARWPNYNGNMRDKECWTYVSGSQVGDSKSQMKFNDKVLPSWDDEGNYQVNIYVNNWYHAVAGIKEIDYRDSTILLDRDLPYVIRPGVRFFIQNVFEELDAPGEWFYDDAMHELYFWPPDNSSLKAVVIPHLKNIIKLDNANNIIFSGLTIEACTSDAIDIKSGNGNVIDKCKIRNTGGYGVVVKGGSNHSVLNSEIFDVGRGAIVLSGGDRRTLRPGNHRAENNNIYQFSQVIRTGRHACTLRGVGNKLSNNWIHNGPDIGICIIGNDHVVEYNEISDVCQELSDTGAIYLGRDWTNRGNLIRYNKIHDVYGLGLSERDGLRYKYESPYQAWGIYLDDCISGTTVYGNVIYRVPLGAVKIGGGNDNIVENNTIVDCIPAVYLAARSKDLYSRLEPILEKRLNEMTVGNSIYTSRYPDLSQLKNRDRRMPMNNRVVKNIIAYSDDNYAGHGSMDPKNGSAVAYNFSRVDKKTTISDRNLFWHIGLPVRARYGSYNEKGTAIKSWDELQQLNLDGNSAIADPGFVDWDSDDYRLLKESEAYRLGFKPLPFEKMGLLSDKNSRSNHQADMPPRKVTRTVYEVHLSN